MAGLFGGARRLLQGVNNPGSDGLSMADKLSLFGSSLNGQVTPMQIRDLRQQGMQAQAQTALSDRLRAQLSPADGPQGSGTGAAPDVQQQMAALNEARLLNPAVADQFTPFVQGNQRQSDAQRLFANDPKAQALYGMGNQSFLDSLGEQYKPQVIGAGGRQSVYGEGRTVDAPNFMTVNDTIFRNDPGAGTSTPTATAPAAYNDVTGRITAERPQIANLSVGQQAYGVGPQGQVSPLAQNTTAAPPSAQQVELRSQYDTNTSEVIPTLTQMRQAVQNGDVITGLGADVRLQAARALAAAGNQDAQRQVAATEAYRNMSGRLRVGMAKTLGANPSNADIKLLEQVTAGDIGQNAQSLLSTIDQGLSFANQRNAALSAQLGQGQSQGQPQGQQPQGRRQITPEQARQMLRERGVAGY